MTKRKLKVLHVTPDDKFFDSTFKEWDSYECIESKAVLIEFNSNYELKYIKNTGKLSLLWNKEMVKTYFQNEEYDVVFFHSLHPRLYKYFKYIPAEKVVIWWMWGLETYTKNAPLIECELFKPITAEYIIKRRGIIHRIVAPFFRILNKIYIQYQRRRVIRRIDYFKPVLGEEYKLMKQIKGFRAKEFYFMNEGGMLNEIKDIKPQNGTIILGNSGTASNNHLDVLAVIEKYKQKSQKIIVPLNYGEDEYIKWILPQLEGNGGVDVIKEFLPIEEYFELMEKCSYACYGVVRQQAMGNIHYALQNGIKVFLYKNSIPYINSKKLGYAVYSIEDINEDSFSTPLSMEEIKQNQEAVIRERKRRFEIFEIWRHDI